MSSLAKGKAGATLKPALEGEQQLHFKEKEPEKIRKLQLALQLKYPHLLGSREGAWAVHGGGKARVGWGWLAGALGFGWKCLSFPLPAPQGQDSSGRNPILPLNWLSKLPPGCMTSADLILDTFPTPSCASSLLLGPWCPAPGKLFSPLVHTWALLTSSPTRPRPSLNYVAWDAFILFLILFYFFHFILWVLVLLFHFSAWLTDILLPAPPFPLPLCLPDPCSPQCNPNLPPHPHLEPVLAHHPVVASHSCSS